MLMLWDAMREQPLPVKVAFIEALRAAHYSTWPEYDKLTTVVYELFAWLTPLAVAQAARAALEAEA